MILPYIAITNNVSHQAVFSGYMSKHCGIIQAGLDQEIKKELLKMMSILCAKRPLTEA